MGWLMPSMYSDGASCVILTLPPKCVYSLVAQLVKNLPAMRETWV